jgi:hypothetical protein
VILLFSDTVNMLGVPPLMTDFTSATSWQVHLAVQNCSHVGFGDTILEWL